MRMLLLIVVLSCPACRDRAEPVRATLLQSAPPSHPLSGFWKDGHCDDEFGLFIAPAGDDQYSVSFCGPGGCFQPGTYRPITSIVGDPAYRVNGANEIEVASDDGSFQRYIRCTANA
jgi:hypothetical protein